MASINIRELAADTLIEILERGQFSHLYLKAVLDKYSYLEKNERAFLTRLVNGTVERKIELDYIIDSYSKTKAKKMKPWIRTSLRMGVFEIYYMDSVPDSATCNEYVKLAKKRGFAGLSGFVNGVLRSIARDKGNLKIEDSAIRYSIPDWLCDMWTKQYGKDKAVEIMDGFFKDESLCIRVDLNKISREDLAQSLKAQGISVTISNEIESAMYIANYDSIASIPEFGQGLFYVQDYSSQLIPYLAHVKEDEDILDLCSAPGGKALHAAMIAKNGHVMARDLTEYKVGLIRENIARAGADNIQAQVCDARVFDENSREKYNLVIADLPCSGLGIIRKKPDIKYNQTPESLKELALLQKQILDNAAEYVCPGGRLSYSTCTINKDENENQVEDFLSSHKEFVVEEMRQLLPDTKHDGFFICVMKKQTLGH
ncbi:MAG: 16S rRNA (cytosine(967)-C(5))-methyltransferase RsmB [Pseudobutyrivibrio sp.]|nr:16S rRNA (cytosine(967)-C(5))-methyltransferase RsmB [Pseudobutyrivibrio sp.]